MRNNFDSLLSAAVAYVLSHYNSQALPRLHPSDRTLTRVPPPAMATPGRPTVVVVVPGVAGSGVGIGAAKRLAERRVSQPEAEEPSLAAVVVALKLRLNLPLRLLVATGRENCSRERGFRERL